MPLLPLREADQCWALGEGPRWEAPDGRLRVCRVRDGDGPMGTSQDEILRMIREHPEGISTTELAKLIPGNSVFDIKRGMVYNRCKRLLAWGDIRRELVPARGRHCEAVWRPVDDS